MTFWGYGSMPPAATPTVAPPPVPMPALTEAALAVLVPLVGRAELAGAIIEALNERFFFVRKDVDPLPALARAELITRIGAICAHGLGTDPCPFGHSDGHAAAYAYQPPPGHDEPDPERKPALRRHRLPGATPNYYNLEGPPASDPLPTTNFGFSVE